MWLGSESLALLIRISGVGFSMVGQPAFPVAHSGQEHVRDMLAANS